MTRALFLALLIAAAISALYASRSSICEGESGGSIPFLLNCGRAR